MVEHILGLINKYENITDDEYMKNTISNTLLLESGILNNYSISWSNLLKARYMPTYYFNEFMDKFDWEKGSRFISSPNLIFDDKIRNKILSKVNWNEYIYSEQVTEEEVCEYKDNIDWRAIDPYKVLNYNILSKYKLLINWNRDTYKNIFECNFLLNLNDYLKEFDDVLPSKLKKILNKKRKKSIKRKYKLEPTLNQVPVSTFSMCKPDLLFNNSILSHGLCLSFSDKEPEKIKLELTALKNLKNILENRNIQICCSRKSERLGPVGIYLKGENLFISNYDLFSSFDEHGRRYIDTIWLNNLKNVIDAKDYKRINLYSEHIVTKPKIIGFWFSKNTLPLYYDLYIDIKELCKKYNMPIHICDTIVE